jgi:hypothetical protein
MMRGSIQITQVVLVVMVVMLVVLATALIIMEMLSEPFMNLEACKAMGGSKCERGEICPSKMLGVVNDEFGTGACCSTKCVREG